MATAEVYCQLSPRAFAVFEVGLMPWCLYVLIFSSDTGLAPSACWSKVRMAMRACSQQRFAVRTVQTVEVLAGVELQKLYKSFKPAGGLKHLPFSII